MLDGFLELLILGGLPFLFLLVFLEGNPVVGSFIPGQVLTILVGFVIATTGIFNIYLAVIVVFIGALLGDLLGYYFGKKYGVKGLKFFGLSEKSTIYVSSEKFFKKFGPWSIILGREFNLTRAFMPFFAGVFQMKYKKFGIFVLISNFIWATLSLFLGFYFGVVVIDKINFLFWFIAFVFVYSIIVRMIYKTFMDFNEKNSILHKYYGLKNIFFIFITFIFLIVFLFYGKWGFKRIFNEHFVFLFFPSLYYYADIVFSKFYLFILLWSNFMFLIFKRNIRLIILFMWGGMILLFISFIFNLFMARIYGFTLYIWVVFFTLLIFYSYILIDNYVKNKILKKKFEFLTIFYLFFSLIAMFAYTEDLFLVLVSFFVGAIACEIIILLSHYQILDKSLSDSLNK